MDSLEYELQQARNKIIDLEQRLATAEDENKFLTAKILESTKMMIQEDMKRETNGQILS